MNRQPLVILQHIVSFADDRGKAVCRSVCRPFLAAVNKQVEWEYLYDRSCAACNRGVRCSVRSGCCRVNDYYQAIEESVDPEGMLRAYGEPDNCQECEACAGICVCHRDELDRVICDVCATNPSVDTIR